MPSSYKAALLWQLCLAIPSSFAEHGQIPLHHHPHHSSEAGQQHRNYVCGDYLHAIGIELPDTFDERGLLLDFIQVDVNCRDHDWDEGPEVGNGTTLESTAAPIDPSTLVNTSDLPATLPESSPIRPNRRRNTAMYRVPSTIHFHVYAVSEDLELRYNSYPPGFVAPILGPLPPPFVPTSVVFNSQQVSGGANVGSPPTDADISKAEAHMDLEQEEDTALLFQRGLSFIYNASVPVNTTHATVELWIPTPYFQRLTNERLEQAEDSRRAKQTIVLGPRFDHSWSVDLTMNPRTTLKFDVNEPFYNVTNMQPPTEVTIFNGGAGTSLVLNYTSTQTSLELVDQTLDGKLHVQQNLWDPNADFVGASTASVERQASDNPMTRIITFGSNTLATVVRGVYADNYVMPTDIDRFSTTLAFDGFQQKVTVAGFDPSKDVDTMDVKGLAVDLFTTADCDDIGGFHFDKPINIEDPIFYDPELFLFDDLESWIARRSIHINYCYEFTMEDYRSYEIIPGLPRTVDRVAFFGNVTEQGPAADSKNIVNTTTNVTSESEFAVTAVPLGPFVRPLGCHSTTDLHNVECVYSGAVVRGGVGFISGLVIAVTMLFG